MLIKGLLLGYNLGMAGIRSEVKRAVLGCIDVEGFP